MLSKYNSAFLIHGFVVPGPAKQPAPVPAMLDLLYDPRAGGDEPVFIKRGLAPGAYGLDLRDFYLA